MFFLLFICAHDGGHLDRNVTRDSPSLSPDSPRHKIKTNAHIHTPHTNPRALAHTVEKETNLQKGFHLFIVHLIVVIAVVLV